MANSIAIGLAEMKISKSPDDVLVAFGLGSCLGIGMYDPQLRLGGMLHAVLPKNTASPDSVAAKYVDSGINALLDEMIKAGALKQRLIIKMAGGANMLNVSSLSKTFDIGNRNAESAHLVFAQLGLRLKTEEIGGKIGRTVRMYISDGKMTIRMMGDQEREI